MDEGSFLEVHKRWAKELVVGYARLEGRVVGIVANQPKQKGGVLFVDSSDKAARFIWTCNAFNVPLLFLADVPGFMIGTQVERQGIIRAGAKMISAVSEATVPEDLGDRPQGLRRRPLRDGRPRLRPRRLHRAAERQDRGDGAAGGDQRGLLQPGPGDRGRGRARAHVERLREEYKEEIDILHLASEMVVDAVIQPEDLRAELVRRFALYAGRAREWPAKHNAVTPV